MTLLGRKLSLNRHRNQSVNWILWREEIVIGSEFCSVFVSYIHCSCSDFLLHPWLFPSLTSLSALDVRQDDFLKNRREVKPTRSIVCCWPMTSIQLRRSCMTLPVYFVRYNSPTWLLCSLRTSAPVKLITFECEMKS